MNKPPLWEQYRERLEALRERPLNFDIERRNEFTAANGWHIDDFQTELPPEPPGPPLPDGSFAAAQRVLREYRFPDPSIITGIFVPDSPLERRVMLLRARYLWMTFYFGVRVGAVRDEVMDDDQGRRQVWGFNYRTLEGHMERGQMEFSVVKWLESGQVAFRIQAFSQSAGITNLIMRLGFRLFGRRLQLRFINRALERMQRLVEDELRNQTSPDAASPPVRPANSDENAARTLDRLGRSS